MVYQVKILSSAIEDAKACYDYIAEASPDNAVKWFNGLFEAVDSLSSMPRRCPVATETLTLNTEIRCLLYRKYYRILYLIEGNIVRIYHIHHATRRYLTREEFFAEPTMDIEEI